ncbi:MAG: NAD(P)-dependent oxidoreductase, partial [Thaumarchaeota archaeon]|nr:NAD(P)-dependent oxidoreductase [Nitrososphaerota archaeon]
MSTLIIGAGLVGSQIAKNIVDNDGKAIVFDLHPQYDSIKQVVDLQNVEIITGDVMNLQSLEELVKNRSVKRIIHTAANSMLTVGAQERPHEAIRLNILGTANVLEVSRKFDLERVVFTSSSVLYTFRKGGLESGKLTEDNYPRPTTIYASTKLACENLGLNYFESYGLDFVAVRFAAVFGPWSGPGGGGPTTMIKQLIEKSLRGEPATVGSRVIEYVYSKDAARGTVLALEAKSPVSRIYNISMGKIYKPEEIASIVSRLAPNSKISIEESSGGPAVKVVEP